MNHKTIYKNLLVLLLVGSMVACGDKHTHNEDGSHTEGHKHNENGVHNGGKNGESEEHSENEEVMLTKQQFDALQFKIDTLSMRNMSGYIEANGQLEVPPQNEAIITTVVGANVVAIKVIEGDKVDKGQTVTYLSHPNIIRVQTDYLNAYSNSVFLNKEYARQKKLYDAGVGSGMDYQKAEAEYQASKGLVSGLEAQLRILNLDIVAVRSGKIQEQVALRSPIEGFVQKVEVKMGQYVDPQTELFEIVNTHHVHADLMVFEKDVYKVKKGQNVRFNIQSTTETELTAKIYSVSKTFEQNPKALHVHAEIENKQGKLIPGMYIQGKIEVDSIKSTALPESAIIKEGERYIVFKAKKEGESWSFIPTEVAVGEKDGGWIVVNFMERIEPNTLFANNNAFYLMAELKKGEAEHSH